APKIVNDQLTPEFRALDLRVAGKGVIEIYHSVFDGCGSIGIETVDESHANFSRNTIRENCLAPINAAPHLSRPMFVAKGVSAHRKHFVGNTILRSWVQFDGSNWMIGGDQDGESNIIVGPRAGLFITAGQCHARGNYIHALLPEARQFNNVTYWSQVPVLSLAAYSTAEQNVLRGGHWSARNVEGEMKFNLLLEPEGHEWIQMPSAGKIHHNIFWASGTLLSGVEVLPERGDGAEIFNNVFDGRGQAFPAIAAVDGGIIKSLRNNVFMNFARGPLVRTGWNEPATVPGPARLGFADCNLFFNPKLEAGARDNYLLTVAGKNERKDDGFAKGDVPKGGAIDEQADPKFKAPVEKFPFALNDIKERKVGVSQILEFFRNAYTPADGSPLIDAGLPADGTDIGAVEAGKVPPSGPGLTATRK
ncbi:MAG TPA: hypothetical protein VEJ63_12635, partial [Planctomycetota bacterium]|nr:hypothetical protein [Planctomycetota bacterium]